MSSNEESHVLDNPAWHALNSHHTHFAVGTSLAKRYPAEVAPFVALADQSDAAFRDLAQIVQKGEPVAIFGLHLPSELAGWTIHHLFTVIQMVSAQPVSEAERALQVVNLTASDVPEMLQLVEMTQPGPFLQRMIEMGDYLGIRQQDQLSAMAGEWMHLPGYHQISAVCTHPDHQGKGYARRLVSRLVNKNWQQDDVPFLHVVPDNLRAIRLYEMLDFKKRGEMQVLVLSR